MHRLLRVMFSLLAGIGLCACAAADDTPQKEIALTEGLALPSAGQGGRSPIPGDALDAVIASGKWTAPKAGDEVMVADGTARKWEAIRANKDGVFQGRPLFGGYVFVPVPSDHERVAILEGSGHAMAYVNGEPRVGDAYSYGYVHRPVLLKKGTNEFLFHVGRGGQLRAKLTAPKASFSIDPVDPTLPDLIAGEPFDGWGAALVVNATTQWETGLAIDVSLAGQPPIRSPVIAVPPLSVTKVPFRIVGKTMETRGKLDLRLSLTLVEGKSLDKADFQLPVLEPGDTHKRTFRSRIDGSVQYYSVVPAIAGGKTKPGLTLTLHGAGVEGSGQAACFARKTWTHVVAATNRRPYGFDWEDWGRLDALEVLDDAAKFLKPDPQRVWLTGHSMGGHGAWHLGVTYPDKFGAIGPSAGWVSMMSYAGARRPANRDPVAEMFVRASLPSDTLALVRNLTSTGVFVLHGDRDDNVPVDQARTMRKELAAFHPDFVYYERPGAGHWWGNECVDWPPMSDYFQKRLRPERGQLRGVEFATASPGVSAQCHWVTIEAQQKSFRVSSVKLTLDPEKRTLKGTTDNVARLSLDMSHLAAGKSIQIELDGQKMGDLEIPADGQICLPRDGEKWVAGTRADRDLKRPIRCGPFREAFRNNVVFVYGTKGSNEENAWALQKARFDAETFWYRGNGMIPIIADTGFDPKTEPDRNVVVYGNANTNAAWRPLLGEGPVLVKTGSVKIGDREETGDDLSCLFVRPRPGTDVAQVGAVSGTGIRGMRRTTRLPYFVSGVGYPDCVLLGPESMGLGIAGVKSAGFFGNDWSVDNGELAWR